MLKNKNYVLSGTKLIFNLVILHLKEFMFVCEICRVCLDYDIWGERMSYDVGISIVGNGTWWWCVDESVLPREQPRYRTESCGGISLGIKLICVIGFPFHANFLTTSKGALLSLSGILNSPFLFRIPTQAIAIAVGLGIIFSQTNLCVWNAWRSHIDNDGNGFSQ